jgi:hypothetical protein
MQTLSIAGSHEAHALGAARSAARLDGLYEAGARWLYRLTLVVGPAWYVARLAKSPLAAHLTEALVAVIAALLIHWLAGQFLKRAHLLSEASFERPAVWADDETDADHAAPERTIAAP